MRMNENEIYLQNMLEHSSAYCFFYDIKKKAILMSDKVVKDFGCAPVYEDMPQSFAREYVRAEDRDAYCALFDSIASGKSYSHGEVRTSLSFWKFNMTLTVSERDSEGKPTRAVGVVDFLSVRDREEKELAETSLSLMTQNFYRISCIDLGQNTVHNIGKDLSQAELLMQETDYDKSILTFCERFVLPEDRAKFINIMEPERMRELFDSGVPYIEMNYHQFEGGVPHYVRSELVPFQDYSEENPRVMWYVRNVAEEEAMGKRIADAFIKINNDANMRIKTILNGITGGFKISFADSKYTYSYVGKRAARLFGYTMEEFMDVTGGNAVGLVYPPDLDKTLKDLRYQLEKGYSYSVKYRVKCKDGSLKWIVDSGTRVVNEDGEVMFYSLYNDVTELETRNKELSDTLYILDIIMESITSGIFAYSLPERNIMTLNTEAKRLFGMERPMTIDEVMDDLMLDEDRPVMRAEVKKLKKPGDRIEFDFRIRRTDSRILNVHTNTALCEFENGERFILSTMNDITEQTRLVGTIKDERKQYRDALVNGSLYAVSVDLTLGTVDFKNAVRRDPVSLEFLSPSSELSFDELTAEWIEKKSPVFTDENAREVLTCEYLLRIYEEGKTAVELEYYNEEADKDVRISILISRRMRDSHVSAFIVATDITEQRRRENRTNRALREAYEAAKRANEAKSTFLSRMSHDIRTPMNAIIGMTTIAAMHLEEKEKVADCLKKITVSSRYLLSVINEILDMSKIESGRVDINESEFDLSELVESLMAAMRPTAEEKGLSLGVFVENISHEGVIGDYMRLRQSLTNLLSNSIKYTREGGKVELRIREIPMHNFGIGRYEFIINDNGVGMEPEFVEHIFEPFARADDSRASKIQGVGLGMAITYNLVHMMNGDIKVSSVPGEGTSVVVTISLKLRDGGEVYTDEFLGLPVLIADSDRESRDSLGSMLSGLGLKCDFAENGTDAVDRVKGAKKDGKNYFAVILDRTLKGSDGVDTAERIRGISGEKTSLILVSEDDISEIESRAREVGVDAFVSKPVFKSRLSHLLHEIIMSDSSGAFLNIDTPESARDKFKGVRILVVEDNEMNADIMTELLTVTGAQTELAKNGKIAVDMFSQSPEGHYQLVFMDIQMPVMNGIDATKAIRALEREDAQSVPIIAITANAFDDDIQATMDAGMNEHLSKPLNVSRIIMTMKKWLY